jgi:hypothetical protein
MVDAITENVYAVCSQNTAVPLLPVLRKQPRTQCKPLSLAHYLQQQSAQLPQQPSKPSKPLVIHSPAEHSQHSPNHATLPEILHNAGQKAVGGGLPGMAAMTVQVISLMWLRTTVNYQYRYGMSTTVALSTLWKEGGVRRFYQGLGPALLQVRV